ncbi:MAG: hypothetical protein J6Y67_00195 [Lachnospiraceae bacterium]|nr:hypothetical protein [Lachnospiraceae bacterium]
MKKILILLLSLCLCACLAACGDDEDEREGKKNDADVKDKATATVAPTEEPTPTEAPDIPTPTEAPALAIATTEVWGDFTVGIPEGWTFRKGDVFDDNDTRYCSVKKSDFSFFDFKMESENIATQQYNYNKNNYTNEQVDITCTYAGIEWTGFQYSDGWGGYGFELITTVNDKPVRVSCCGFRYDSEAAVLVLESLSIK